MSDNAKWYVVHTYSGYENAVKTTIEKFVANRHLEEMILDIQIPLETVTEISEDGVAKEVERKVFPGYVLLKMVMTDDTWHLVRNVRGVTGFVGEASNKPIPLTEEEVLALGMEKHEIVVSYNVGDRVRINDGPLESFTGIVDEIDAEKNKVVVVVSMFGRETPVEMELDQVEVVAGYLRRRGRGPGRTANALGVPPAAGFSAFEGPGSGGFRTIPVGRPRSALPGRQAPRPPHFIKEVPDMAQKVVGYVKLQIPAGKATPAPPVGPALGQHGVNIAAFTKEFNERTKGDMGMIIPVIITVYSDRSFTFVTKTPPAAVLIKKACNIESGSGVPNKTKVATISKADVQKIAETKMPDLNAASLESAMSMIAGTARSMGVVVGE